MEIPFKSVVWNEHEIALLVDTFEKVREGVISRNKAIVNLSIRLRNRMVLDGIAINERYRNVAGMNLQLLSLERSIDSTGNLIENNQLSKNFRAVYLLSKNARDMYHAILSEAKLLYPDVCVESDTTNAAHPDEWQETEQTKSFVNEAKNANYKAYFSTNPVSAPALEQTSFVPRQFGEQTIKEIKRECAEKGSITETTTDNLPLQPTSDTLSQNGFSHVLKPQPTIYENLKSKMPTAAVDEKMLVILTNKFSKGYRLDSPIARKRFSKFYTEEYGKDLEMPEERIDLKISEAGIVYNGLVYIPDCVLDGVTRQSLFRYIEAQFACGIVCIYYDVLFEHFSQQFLGQTMIDGAMLRYYLEYYNVDNTYHFYEQYFSQEASANIDINEEVVDYVKAQGGCVAEDEIAAAFAHLPREKVIEVFSGNPKTLVLSSMKTRFHIDNFQLENIDKITIVDFLSKEIASMQYVTFSELFDKMKVIAPRIIENNIQFTQTGIRTALSSLLADKFHFVGGFISDHDNPVSAQDAFIGIDRGRESFNIEEVETMAKEFNVPINFEALAENNVRVSEDMFVSKDHITFDTDLIDMAIARFCQDEFVGITEVNTFTAFPECGYRWTPYLLESYLYSYSKMFTLKHKAFNKTSVAGAIIRKISRFTDYIDIMAAALANAGITLNKQSSLEFLVKNGYIERRRLNTIDDVIRRAESLKNN